MPETYPEFWPLHSPDNGPWKVATRTFSDGWWYIYNTETGAHKKIGRVSKGRGTNYYDRAVNDAWARNEALRKQSADQQ